MPLRSVQLHAHAVILMRCDFLRVLQTFLESRGQPAPGPRPRPGAIGTQWTQGSNRTPVLLWVLAFNVACQLCHVGHFFFYSFFCALAWALALLLLMSENSLLQSERAGKGFYEFPD